MNMTYPRSHLVDPAGGGVYHVHSRCVRRAFLCGKDKATGRDFSHRRAWIERRILSLAEIFAVSIYGYAVMSNHYHIVLELQPERCRQWSDEDIADRWLTLCPGRQVRKDAAEIRSIRRVSLLADQQRLAELRSRLASLSWFMRFINEPLARYANAEDDCTGRFWEGRFKSQVLLDEAAVLACMVYVDLNPVRAGVAHDLGDCDFTSVRRRLDTQTTQEPLGAIGGSASPPPPFSAITLGEYVDLARWTATIQDDFRRGLSSAPPLSVIGQRDIDHEQWLSNYLPKPGRWQRALGSVASLRDYARRIGQSWIKSTYLPSSA